MSFSRSLSFVIAAVINLMCWGVGVDAQVPSTLPAVAGGSAIACAKLNASWIPGVLRAQDGTFVSFAQRLRSLRKLIKRSVEPRRTKLKLRLRKARKQNKEGLVSCATAGAAAETAAASAARGMATGAVASSEHYVDVFYSGVVSPSTVNIEEYSIRGPDGAALRVFEAIPSADSRTVVLRTEKQSQVDYTLTILSTGQKFIFRGSGRTEPFLATAISLSSTSVLLTFSDPMSNDVSDIRYYDISSPFLSVLSATRGADPTQVFLTTSPQSDTLYSVRVTNVTAQNGKRINSDRNTAAFNGVAVDDISAPRLLSAAALTGNSIQLLFSEPLDPNSILISAFSLAPEVVVTDATLTNQGTRVVLKTQLLTAGETYTVLVSGVTDLAGNEIDAPDNTKQFTFSGVSGEVDAGARPYMTGALSQGNTSVLVSFNKPMGPSAVVASNYSIVQENLNPEVGALSLLSASFLDQSRTAVLLQTTSQNEVTYRVFVTNVKDISGVVIDAPRFGDGSVVNPASALFAGTPPSATTFVDTDDDGLADSEETRGWLVTVFLPGNQTTQIQVTSDPTVADTDNDGLSDKTERALVTNPRDTDTDDDELNDRVEYEEIYSSPINSDSDNDEISDGLEVDFFLTSPLFADTDGDQLDDGLETVLDSRDPRISDLPRPRIKIGDVNIALDTRFSYTDEQGTSRTTEETNTASLTQSENQTFATSDETSTKATIEVSTELGIEATFPKGGGVTTSLGIKSGFELGNTSTFSSESSESSEEAFENSLTTSETVDVTKTVNREVVDASMLVDATIENVGDISFTISNLELSALVQSPSDRSKFLPVASLKPQSPLGELNLGALGLVSERGPIVFSAEQIFPQVAENLLKNPRGVIVKLSNFDITDELGRNFAFTSQEVFDRTAGISIDYGDGRVDSFRVATANGFYPNGQARGITMAYALDSILGFHQYDTVRDGGNGIVETFATGDDSGIFGTSMRVDPGATLITAGENGLLDTAPQGDDVVERPGFATTVVPRTVDGVTRDVAILTRIGDVETGIFDTDPNDKIDERRTFWVVFSKKGVNAAANFEDLVLRAGDQYSLTFVQDKDNDGVFSREEYLHGSSDSNKNTDGCPDDNPDTAEFDGTCTRGVWDLLTDYQEIKEGWLVRVEGRVPTRAFSDPIQADSDGDRLFDHEEKACGLDPRQKDTDLDGLSDSDEIFGYDISEEGGVLIATVPPYSGRVILDGGNGVVETTRSGDDLLLTLSEPGGVIISAGANGAIDSTLGGDDFIGALHTTIAGCKPGGNLVENFGTNPLDGDTDDDGINDGAETILGINPNNPFDGLEFRDSDQDGVADAFETRGFQVLVNGVTRLHVSDPFDPDTDNDRLPDLLEHFLGSNPSARDTDSDGIEDFDEFDAGDTCTTGLSTGSCMSFISKNTKSYQEFLDSCSLAQACTFTEADLGSYGSDRTGTNLNERDTDNDGLTDSQEIAGYTITVAGVQRNVDPDEFDSNSDADGWNDGTERTRGTDATDADTDDDGTNDDTETGRCVGFSCRNPLVKDAKITAEYTTLNLSGDCDELDNKGDFRWQLGFREPGTGAFGVRGGGDQDTDRQVDNSETIGITGSSWSFIADFGEVFEFAGWVAEIDGDNSDESLTWQPNGCSLCSFIPDASQSVKTDTSHTVGTVTSKQISWNASRTDVCGTFQDVNWTVFATISVE